MRVRSLEAFGLSRQLLEVWERQWGEALLPAQGEALRRSNLLRGGSLILYAPTGAGKTLVGEIAALQAATHGRRALYLVPTKALAEEKYATLCRLYAGLGLRIVISTRDRRGDDGRLLRGEFDLAVAVPEKAHYLLNLSPTVVRSVGCVVVDELQLLGDAQRGPVLEVTLAHLRGACAELQIVGLSAVLRNPDLLAEWLGAEWLEVKQRPVELRQGVLTEGVFRFREYNTGQIGEERWEVDPGGLGWEEAAAGLARQFAIQGEPTLLFLPDRPSVVKMALRLAEEAGLPAAEWTQERLRDLPPTAVRDRLREVAAAGVAFHSSDLQWEERQIVEEGFASGEIALLCSTSTLALGVNLPAKNVILSSERWEQPLGVGRPVRVPLSRSEFENMGGRAGRPGLREDFGRAILLAESAYQREMLLERYTSPDFETLSPALGGLPPLSQLALLCGGQGEDLESIVALYRRTYTAYAQGRQEAEALPPVLQAAVGLAGRYGLLAEREPGRLQITALGRLAASSGVSLQGFHWLARHVRQSSKPPGNLALLYLAATAPEAEALCFPLGGATPERGDWFGELAAQGDESDRELLESLRNSAELSLTQKMRAARLTLALLRWRSQEMVPEIEAAVRVPAGRLATAAETVAWLVSVAVQIGAEQGWPTSRMQAGQQWAEEIATGLPAEALPLHRALRGTVGRDRVLALRSQGIHSADDLRSLTPGELRRLLPEAEWREPSLPREAPGPTLRRREREQPPLPLPALGQAPPAHPSARCPVLRLDPSRPDQAVFYGEAVPLRPAEYRLLAALAAQPGRCIPYQRLYDTLWGPEEIVEPQQIHWHRSRLLAKLRRVLPEGAPSPLRTVPKRGFVLELNPEEVECVEEVVRGD